MSEVEIRQAEPGDARAIAGIHVRSFLSTYSHLPRTTRSAETGLEGRVVVWEERLRRQYRTTLVATEAGRVVGFIHFGSSSDDDADGATGHIYSVHVEPDLTGRGVGGQLVGAALKALLDSGYGAATLWVVEDNERARRFYDSLGWTPDDASRIERLAVGDEEGDEVDVVRLRRQLVGVTEGA